MAPEPQELVPASIKGLWPEDTEAGWLSRLENPLNLGIMAPIVDMKPFDGYLVGTDIRHARMTVEKAKEECFHLPHCRGFCYPGPPDARGEVEVFFKGVWGLTGEGQGCTSWRVLREGESGPGRPIGFVHHFPERPFVYGNWFGMKRAPVVFIEAPSRALTDYIRSDPLGPFTEGTKLPTLKPNWTDWGFREDKERVWKAEWHTLPVGTEEADILIPRLGKRGSVARAPPRVEAFAEAFRNVNREAWSIIHDKLHDEFEKRSRSTVEYRNVKGLAKCILDHTHFGVIEAQVRWGNEDIKLPSHVDGSTSMLHLSLTLGGSRILRLGVFPSEDSAGNARGAASSGSTRLDPDEDPWETDVWNEKVWKREHIKEIQMTRGSAYLSSPFCCEHAVRYHRCPETEPVIALQFRFAFKGEYGLSVNWVRNDDMHVVTKVIAGVLKVAGDSGYLRMPSLDELKAAEERLQKAAASRARLRRLKQKREQQAAAQGVAPLAGSTFGSAVGAPAGSVASGRVQATPANDDPFFAGLPMGQQAVMLQEGRDILEGRRRGVAGMPPPGTYGFVPGHGAYPSQSRVAIGGLR